jgi:hypothetical protein
VINFEYLGCDAKLGSNEAINWSHQDWRECPEDLLLVIETDRPCSKEVSQSVYLWLVAHQRE